MCKGGGGGCTPHLKWQGSASVHVESMGHSGKMYIYKKYGVIQHSLNKSEVSRYETLKGGAIGVTKSRSLGTRSVYRLHYVLYIIAKRKSLSFNF